MCELDKNSSELNHIFDPSTTRTLNVIDPSIVPKKELSFCYKMVKKKMSDLEK